MKFEFSFVRNISFHVKTSWPLIHCCIWDLILEEESVVLSREERRCEPAAIDVLVDDGAFITD